ncbi:hypothetical protein OpiT1DRAFT_01330 [Opitutaceae bacterium TAV1]|nr:hypothetical protein OpiT1DRAFT_01330 [Opitutaceae bacterium TAV1]
MKTATYLLIAALAGLATLTTRADFNFLGGVSLPDGAEIISFDRASGSLLATWSSDTGHRVQVYSLDASGSLSGTRAIDLTPVFGTAADTFSLTSVVADSQGRDFGVATLVPADRGNTVGKAVVFQISTGAILNTFDVGYHPDSVAISPDGNRIVIANEGEFINTTTQTPGSVSVINLTGVTSAAGIGGLTGSAVTTVTFTPGNLASGVSIDGLRNSRDTLADKIPAGERYLDIEPEYVSAGNDKAYISLQENNAIAVLDYATGQITAIHDLGTVELTVDASDRDGGIAIDDAVTALRMPDTVATFARAGETYVITANEGDFRPDDGDRIRMKDLGKDGAPALDPATKAALDARYGGNALADSALGRLRISAIDGDTDGDGDIDVPTLAGSRGVTIINAETGAIVFDSGSMIEEYVATHDPETFNINAEDVFLDDATLAELLDVRSADKGPEIEAVAFGQVNGRDYLFAAAERQNGIFAFDITDFDNVQIVDYYNLLTGENGGGLYVAPESLLFISAEDSPTGTALLVAGFEISGSIAVFDLSGLAAVPEPSIWTLLAAAGGLAFAGARRLRRSAN